MDEYRYCVVDAKKSRCPECSQSVTMLQPMDLVNVPYTTVMFYICWNCRKVFQTGIGECPQEEGG